MPKRQLLLFSALLSWWNIEAKHENIEAKHWNIGFNHLCFVLLCFARLVVDLSICRLYFSIEVWFKGFTQFCRWSHGFQSSFIHKLQLEPRKFPPKHDRQNSKLNWLKLSLSHNPCRLSLSRSLLPLQLSHNFSAKLCLRAAHKLKLQSFANTFPCTSRFISLLSVRF
jgi:hypothetical protein